MTQEEIERFYRLAKPQGQGTGWGFQSPEEVYSQLFPEDPQLRQNYINFVKRNIQGNFGVYDDQISPYEKWRIRNSPYNQLNYDAVNFEGRDRPDRLEGTRREVLQDARTHTVKDKNTVNAEREIRKQVKAKADAWVKSELQRLDDGGAHSYTEGSSTRELPPRTRPQLQPTRTPPRPEYVPFFTRARVLDGLTDPRVQLAGMVPDAYNRGTARIQNLERNYGEVSYPRKVLENAAGIAESIYDTASLGLYDYMRYGPQYSPNTAAVINMLTNNGQAGVMPASGNMYRPYFMNR